MPSDKTSNDKDGAPPAGQTSFSQHTNKVRHFFSIPAPVKTLFDKVPVLTYPPNDLPQRAPKSARIPSLYVFIKKEDAAAGRPSYNPSCLKWQVSDSEAGMHQGLDSTDFLELCRYQSPSDTLKQPCLSLGRLPFLLPPSKNPQEVPTPITSNKLVKYAEEQGKIVEESSSMRYEAYQSLIDHRIRDAWLYTLYLEPLNFSAVAYHLYVTPTSTNPLVLASISHQLRSAAEAELLTHSSIIDTDDLYSEADKAFEALSILLGEDSWFFGNSKPTLFDASIFAYTQLLLDDELGWQEKKLCRALRRRANLVQHRERLLVRYFGGE
ncbi:Metaxin-1 [Lachnellula cervina]|uniref:Metaxin-1 n=1 Tax=Lachnellula cervina TaxID=1316786 RepID=A0A7D8USI3_9HELO|nr:Metaxin-1 [Lachnellula cervina]